MKFAILALLATAVSADACDPSKMAYEIYQDENCKNLNERATKQYGKIQPNAYAAYSPGCHELNGYSYTASCDQEGFHQTLYKGSGCKHIAGRPIANGGKWNYQWNTCEQNGGQGGLRFVLRTKQVFQDSDGPTI